jgi:ABC-type multidrug transport system ATPase subunit
MQTREILTDASGYVEPGSLLAIMGASGGGKSTLLDALAGRLAKNTRVEGSVLVNGTSQRLSYGNSAYVTQVRKSSLRPVTCSVHSLDCGVLGLPY